MDIDGFQKMLESADPLAQEAMAVGLTAIREESETLGRKLEKAEFKTVFLNATSGYLEIVKGKAWADEYRRGMEQNWQDLGLDKHP